MLTATAPQPNAVVSTKFHVTTWQAIHAWEVKADSVVPVSLSFGAYGMSLDQVTVHARKRVGTRTLAANVAGWDDDFFPTEQAALSALVDRVGADMSRLHEIQRKAFARLGEFPAEPNDV